MSAPSPWRPRLVAEGSPLYEDGDDHSMEEQTSPTRTAASAQASTFHRLDHSTDDHHVAPGSSLSRAAGPIPVRQHHIHTRLVIGGEEEDDDDGDMMACSPVHSQLVAPPRQSAARSSHRRKTSPVKMRLAIGGEEEASPQHQEHVERMEGVQHLDPKGPLVVMDGANISYAYADAMAGHRQSGSAEPDARGIQVAANYFLAVHVRVLVVIPAPWFRTKPRAGDEGQGNSLMMTPQLEVLKDLKAKGLLVAAPPRDDDDAYALTIARREDTRERHRGGGGYVLSCDMFRDAIRRDTTGELHEWLTKGHGRISFAFCDMGSTDDYGDPEMDFVPNPRHPLIVNIERQHRNKAYSG